MDTLTTMFAQVKAKLSRRESTDAAYETLRASSDSNEKLLPRVADKEDGSKDSLLDDLRKDLRRARLHTRLLTAMLVSLVAFVSFFWVLQQMSSAHSNPQRLFPIHCDARDEDKFVYNQVPEVFSPAMEAVEYKEMVFHNNFRQDRTKWQGPPDDEVDKAWKSIYIDIGVIKIPKADADKLPNSTLPIPGEDDGYIVALEVYHQLHCLDLLRKHLYPERYGADTGMSPAGKKKYWVHLEHCIDNLRQTIMCHSDISTIPWKNHELGGQFPDAHSTHVCRDFDKLTEWMLHPDRHFPQEEYQLRINALNAAEGHSHYDHEH